MPELAIPHMPQARGRGARSNRSGRHERHARSAFDDGWLIDEDLPPLRTDLTEERTGRILTRNDSPDLGFDRSINPYRGCEHGCTYCYARPSHAWLGLSPGLDFETRLVVKPGAAEALAQELSAPGYEPALIAVGTNTDPYQPVERDRGVMRACLEVLERFRHPVGIVTKGTLVARDADILGRMGRMGLARVGVSLATLDAGLARSMEPRVPSPANRLRVIERLAKAGCPVRVFVAPVIPGLTEHEMERILHSARDAGAEAASMAVLRLPQEVAAIFEEWLRAARPDAAERVLRAVRALHGGRLHDPEFGRRMRGQGPVAALIRQRFTLACRKLGLATRLDPLRCDLFRVPPRPGEQLSLF